MKRALFILIFCSIIPATANQCSRRLVFPCQIIIPFGSAVENSILTSSLSSLASLPIDLGFNCAYPLPLGKLASLWTQGAGASVVGNVIAVDVLLKIVGLEKDDGDG